MVETTERPSAFEQRFAACADTSGFAPRKSTITPGHSAIDKAATRVGLNLRPIYAPCEPCAGDVCGAVFASNFRKTRRPAEFNHRSQNIKSRTEERNVSSRLTGA